MLVFLIFSHSNKSVVHKSSIRSIEAGFKIGRLPNFFTKIGILGGIVDNLRRLLGVEYRLAFFVVVLVLGVVVEGFSPFLMKYSIQKKKIFFKNIIHYTLVTDNEFNTLVSGTYLYLNLCFLHFFYYSLAEQNLQSRVSHWTLSLENLLLLLESNFV